jgi:PmbA protein
LFDVHELQGFVERALSVLVREDGVKEVEVFASSSRFLVCRLCYASNVPCNALEEPKSEDSFGLGVRVLFEDEKLGFGKADAGLDLEDAKIAFENAKKSAVRDPDFSSFPFPRNKKNVFVPADKKLFDVDDETAIDFAYGALNGAFGELEKKSFFGPLNVTGELDFFSERIAVANSNGVCAFDESAHAVSSLTTIFEGKNEVSGMWFGSSPTLNGFDPESTGRISVEKAFSLVGGKKVLGGNVDVVLGPLAFADMVYSRFSVSLSSVDVNASPFSQKLDSRIGSDCVSIEDNALLENGLGSRAVTDEGVPTGRTSLVRNGVLTNFLSDDYHAKKYGANKRFNAGNGFRGDYSSEPGVSATNLVVSAGNFSKEELISEVNNGIYVGRIWYTYPVNGLASADFTSTIRGDSYVIENGKIVSPLVPNTLRISDNFERVLRNVFAVSKKQVPVIAWGEDSAVVTPHVAVKGLKVERIAKALY